MQLVIFALLGCCVVANSASLSADTQTLRRSGEPAESLEKSDVLSESELLESGRRLKRSGGGGSGGFLAGIGSAILGKVAEASSGASSGSSDSSTRGHQYESVEYGPPVHSYDENNFDIWSFKKAILNTLFQALKAIGGGVIALKGKLIKGGGIVISTKGSIISAKGEAISSLGRHIAASAVLTPPKTSQGYVYEAPAVHVPTGHDAYQGPPPSPYIHHGGYATGGDSDSYGHSAFASPSDDADHPGLVIVKPAKPEAIEHHSYQNFGDDSAGINYHHEISPRHPSFSVLAESFGGNQKDSGLGNLVRKLTGASGSNLGKGNGADLSAPAPASPEVTFDVSHSVEDVEHKEENLESGGSDDHRETHVVHNDHKDSGQSHNYNFNYENPYQNLQISYDAKNKGNFASSGNTDFVFFKSLEIPILQNQKLPLYFPPTNNHLQEFGLSHNSYGALKRNGRSRITPGVRIIPGLGYPQTDPRLYKI